MRKNWEIKVILLTLVLLVISMVIAFFVGRNSSEEPSVAPEIECGKRYVSKDLYECQLIDFRCEEGKGVFTDEFGCGCTVLNC